MRLGNTFEEVLGYRLADFNSLRERLLAAGATDVRMTGSGSAVFGVLDPDIPAQKIITRFEGSEALFVVRPRVAGLLLKPRP
jgi:4-diphosphocytidyl-2C-methyl-D-erythritol kinase